MKRAIATARSFISVGESDLQVGKGLGKFGQDGIKRSRVARVEEQAVAADNIILMRGDKHLWIPVAI